MDPYTGQPLAAAPAKRTFGQRGPLAPAEKARRQKKAAATRAAKKAAAAGNVAATPAAAQAAANATGQPVAVAGTTQVAKPGGRRGGGRGGRGRSKPGIVTRVARAVGVGGGTRRGGGRRRGGRKSKADQQALAQAAVGLGGMAPAAARGRGGRKPKAEGGTAKPRKATHKGERTGSSFYSKHRNYVLGACVIGGAAAVNQVDALIKARPLGENVAPSLMAIPVLLLGAYGTRKYGGRGAKPIADSIVALSVGLGTGNLVRAITQRSGGGVSGASLEGTQSQQLAGGEPLEPTPES